MTTWPKQSELESVFGPIEIGRNGRPTDRWEGRALTEIRLPYPMRLAADPKRHITHLTCHRRVAGSLGCVLGEILSLYGSAAEVKKAGLDLLGGTYLYGGNPNDPHAHGIAIDLGGTGKDGMPKEVAEIFEAEGWKHGGKADPNHFQACR